MYRNRLHGAPPAANSSLPAAAATLPMHVRARKLASKIMMSDKSSPATRANAGAVRESLAMEDKSLVTLIEDVELACTQEAYEACEREVKRRKTA